MPVSLKKHLKKGDLIRTSDNEVYQVLALHAVAFECKNIALETTTYFYYSVPAIIFREVKRNVGEE